MSDLDRPIRLLRPSRYGTVGSINTKLDYGVRATLVERGVAEWCADHVPEPSKKPRKQGDSDKGT